MTLQSDSLCLQGAAHFNICQEEGAFNLNKVLCYSLTLFIAFYLYRSINIPESLYSHLLTDGGVTSFVLCSEAVRIADAICVVFLPHIYVK